ncbi:MAG: hypothetical protein S4CHLAM37_02950 [Chlamydiia bacterium]|nr:hypothetical protein [Chlamydiia bacterium]
MELEASTRFKKTRFALLWMHLANEPLMALYTLLAFILRKDLGATTFQLTVFVTLRPVISFFSFYWSSSLTRQKDKLIPNLTWAWVLGKLPFIFLPFFSSVWYLIFASALYQLFYRAGTPALMEIMKVNIEKKKRETLFSYVFLLCFAESIFLGLFVGKFLDAYPFAWKILFIATALISISSVFFQKRIPLPKMIPDKNTPPKTKSKLLQPWKDCLYLMRTYPEFAKFQWGFMIGGFGLMLIAPALAIYFAETLSLSHETITNGRYIWMGFGVLISTFLWRKGIEKYSVKKLTSLILVGFGFFPILLLFAKISLIFLNLAFLLYGVAQAGSHLLWHLSGTLFASEEESSSKYTGTNVLMVGIRGLIGPSLGGVLISVFSPSFVLALGGIICLFGSYYILRAKSLLLKRPVQP